jgi:hypothetical protein
MHDVASQPSGRAGRLFVEGLAVDDELERDVGTGEAAGRLRLPPLPPRGRVRGRLVPGLVVPVVVGPAQLGVAASSTRRRGLREVRRGALACPYSISTPVVG